MYSYFRRIRNIGRIRAWYAAKADYAIWDDAAYPPPPRLPPPDPILFEGSWADIQPSTSKWNRYYRTHTFRERQKKIARLRKRRDIQKKRAKWKLTGNW